MGRSPCCDESGLKKGPWTPEEDDKLIKFIHKHGHASWRALPKLAGLNRCGKSCRLRWTNYLRPDIKRGKFSQEEEQTILHLHSILGNKWSAIAQHLAGRTDNEIKNFWNTHLKKKLIQNGFDPMTHRPRTDHMLLPQLIALANLIQNPMRLQNSLLQSILHQPLLLPPINGSPSNNSSLQNLQPPPLVPCSYDPAVPFSHLPDLQQAIQSTPEYLMERTSTHGENNLLSSSTWPVLPETSVNTNTGGDACSTSSYAGGDQMWSELLLDDPLFHDIA